MVPTRYGSSPMHSSTRPQRGSRMTSRTGARPWWMPSSLLDQIGVERRTPGERRRERGGLPRGEAREALLVDEGGDAQTRLTLEAALLGPQPGGALGRLHRAGAIDARVVADAVLGDLGEIAGVHLAGGHLGLHRRDRTVLVKPVAHELGQLLLERHLSVERSHALGHLRHGEDDVGHRALLLCRDTWVSVPPKLDQAPTQPLTAPVRPPTMRRSNSEKNTSAGIIDSDVNASTRAVSTEYCDANDWTPRGSVYEDSLLSMNSGSM